MDDVLKRRVTCAWLWLAVAAVGLYSRWFGHFEGVAVAWFGAIVITFVTAASARVGRDESLVKPWLFRAAAGSTLAVSLAGLALGALPHTSGFSEAMAVYFGLIVVLSCLALLARGPRASFVLVPIALLAWFPPLFFGSLGCRRYHVTHWTERASMVSLQALLCLLTLLAAAALVAWRPRDNDLPEARAVR